MAVPQLRSPTRRALLQSLALTASAASFPSAAQTPALSFVCLGDWGRRGGAAQRPVAHALGAAAQEIGARFVATVGDNFYESGVQSVEDSHWRDSFEDIYTAPALQIPWYAVLGNHDHRGAPQAQVDYSTRSPRWRMPQRYYTLTPAALGAEQAQVFCLDTTALVVGLDAPPASTGAQDARAQLAWLETELAQSAAPWRIVIGHHTVHSGGAMHGDTAAMVTFVKPLLEAHGVQLYLHGHDHDLQHIRRGTVDFVCSGAGSAVRPVRAVEGTRFCRSRPGFAALALRGETLDLEFRDLTGASLYRASLPRLRS